MTKTILCSALLLSGCAMSESPTSPTPLAQQVYRINLRVGPENPTRPQDAPLLLTIETVQQSGWGAGNQDVVLEAAGGRLERLVVRTDSGGVAQVRAWPDGSMRVTARHAGGAALALRFDAQGNAQASPL